MTYEEALEAIQRDIDCYEAVRVRIGCVPTQVQWHAMGRVLLCADVLVNGPKNALPAVFEDAQRVFALSPGG